MKTMYKFLPKENLSFIYAHYFLLLFICPFLISFLGFFAGFSMSRFYFPICILVSSYVFIVQMKNLVPLREAVKHLLFVTLLLLGAFIVCTQILDTSYDGLWYHQHAIIKLSEGWNPVQNPFYAPTKYEANNYLWIQHYPKASWIISASIYKMCGWVESGKTINFISAFSVLFFAYAVFLKLLKGRPVYALAFALIISFNPAVTSQLLTDYVDGNISAMLSLILLCLLNLQQTDKYFARWNWFVLCSALVIISNIKFTGLFMAGIMIGIFSLYWWWNKEPMRMIFRKYILIAGVAIGAIVIFGCNPYFYNWYYKGYVFYPLNVKEKISILESALPESLEGKNSLEKLFISTFSEADAETHSKNTNWKNPFTVTQKDIRVFASADVRLGARGPLFLLAFLLSILSAVIFFSQMPRAKRGLLVCSLLAVFISVILTPYGWWARYTPQFFLIPVLLNTFSLSTNKTYRTPLIKYLPVVVLALFCLNLILVGAPNLVANIIKTRNIQKEMTELKAKNGPILINFSHTQFQAIRTRLKEAGIQFKDCDTLKTNVQELISINRLYGYGPLYQK